MIKCYLKKIWYDITHGDIIELLFIILFACLVFVPSLIEEYLFHTNYYCVCMILLMCAVSVYVIIIEPLIIYLKYIKEYCAHER